jgi:hypothetical protein
MIFFIVIPDHSRVAIPKSKRCFNYIMQKLHICSRVCIPYFRFKVSIRFYKNFKSISLSSFPDFGFQLFLTSGFSLDSKYEIQQELERKLKKYQMKNHKVEERRGKIEGC